MNRWYVSLHSFSVSENITTLTSTSMAVSILSLKYRTSQCYGFVCLFFFHFGNEKPEIFGEFTNVNKHANDSHVVVKIVRVVLAYHVREREIKMVLTRTLPKILVVG